MTNQLHREPDFENISKVLRCEKPSRPTLFEFFMNGNVYEAAAGPAPQSDDPVDHMAYMARAFAACGYDYVNYPGCDFGFPTGEKTRKNTIS